MQRALILTILLTLLPLVPAEAGPTVLTRPLRVEIVLRASDTNPREQKLNGMLTQFDDSTLTIKIRQEERTLKWIDLTPGTAFDARRVTINQSSAADWLELGRFGWSIKAGKRTEAALARAVKLDPSLQSEVDRIHATEAGSAFNPPEPERATSQPATAPTTGPTTRATSGPTSEPTSDDPNGSGAIGALPPAQSAARVARDKLIKYQKATPEERANAIEQAQKIAKDVSAKLNVKFTEIQTDHFIIFTDWDAREFGFLRENVEAAYTVVSKQFDIPVKENVFVGKLPVFMFSTHNDFLKFTRGIDHFQASPNVAGYYAWTGDTGVGHMVMWKPSIVGNNTRPAELQWAYVLTHEFTHAFVARYRSNQTIPRWLNEGLAEVIAQSKFPKQNVRELARRMVYRDKELNDLFEDTKMPAGEMYPVMKTMVQMLIDRDNKAFIEFFDDIKYGEEPEAALKKHFNLDYAGLLKAWKMAIVRA